MEAAPTDGVNQVLLAQFQVIKIYGKKSDRLNSTSTFSVVISKEKEIVLRIISSAALQI